MSEPTKDADKQADQQTARTASQAQDVGQGVGEAAKQAADAAAQHAASARARAEQAVKTGSEAAERATNIAVSDARDLMAEWMSLVQESMERNINAMSRMARCRTPQDILMVQSDLIADSLLGATETARRMSAASMSAFRNVSTAISPPNFRA